MEDDTDWNQKIDEAMHAGKEKWYTLKNKILVYIGFYFRLARQTEFCIL
jgi:hypothetical protein